MSKQHQNVAKLRALKSALPCMLAGSDQSTGMISAMDWAIRTCEAADNLINVRGRHHGEVAYRRLEDAVKKEAP